MNTDEKLLKSTQSLLAEASTPEDVGRTMDKAAGEVVERVGRKAREVGEQIKETPSKISSKAKEIVGGAKSEHDIQRMGYDPRTVPVPGGSEYVSDAGQLDAAAKGVAEHSDSSVSSSILSTVKEKASDVASKVKSFAQEHPVLAAAIPAALAAGAGAAALLRRKKMKGLTGAPSAKHTPSISAGAAAKTKR